MSKLDLDRFGLIIAKGLGCAARLCNHPLDPEEYECGYDTILACDECKYGGGNRDPEAKRNQIK